MKFVLSLVLTCIVALSFGQPLNLTIFNSTNTPALTTSNFTAIGVGKNGHIWAGTSNLGLFKYNGTYWEKATAILLNNNIGDIKTDIDGGIWIAQYGNTGAQALTGGLNYFPDTTFAMTYFAVTAGSGGGGMPTRYVKSVYVNNNQAATLPQSRVWTACMGTITGGNPNPGAIGRGSAVATPGFRTINEGIDVASLTSSIQAIDGNGTEVWAYAASNFSKNQILKYNASTNALIGTLDNSNSILPVNFTARAVHFDNNNRTWIGMSAGTGVYVNDGSLVQIPTTIFPAGAAVNPNAITHDFSGKVYIGTTAGLFIYNGGSLTDPANYVLYTTANGLPTNNVKGICIDSLGGRILISTDNGIAFWKKETKIQVDLVWDYSAPSPGVQPKGVVADGVSRLYLRIKKGMPDTNIIKEVSIALKDTTRHVTLRGKVKTATNITTYSDEAATGGSGSAKRSDSTAQGEYWFWYLSPEDFSRSNLGEYVALGERADTIKVKFTYRSNMADSIETDIKIARPPLVMVHGLAGGPGAWDNFRHDGSTPFIYSPLFRHKRALTMGGQALFRDNARLLLAGTDPGQKLNSLPGNVESIRKLGYAANQLDYVCHSMGGLMARSAINWYPEKYYNNPVYKTYGKGFIHKLITINTPHNSSPVADAIAEFIPELPEVPRVILNTAYIFFPDEQKPFDFFTPVNPGDLLSPFKPTNAVKNLAVSESNGGINLEATTVKNHLIAGDVNYEILSATGNALIPYQKFMELLDDVLDVARDKATGTAKVILTGFYGLNKAARALSYLEYYGQSKGFPAFLGDGDLIVPLMSQTARQNPFSPHITLFYNSQGSLFDASHVTILDRADVGQHTLNMLNSAVNGTFFANSIPANVDPARMNLQRPADAVAISTNYDTTFIKITTPTRGMSPTADSTLTVKVNLKDTVGLAYVKIYFQGGDTATLSRTAAQQFSFKINRDYVGPQKIYAEAVYDRGNNAEHHVDTVYQNIVNLRAADGFRILKDTVEITAGQLFYPSYEASYNGVWSRLANNASGIAVTPQSTTAITYSSFALNGQKDTTVNVYFSYNSFKDTMLFVIKPALNSSCINRTIASGNFSNPAIWSKMVIPGECDSVIISATHQVIMDTSVQVNALRISATGRLTIQAANKTLTIGDSEEALDVLDNYGNLTVTAGAIRIKGRLQFQPGSTFNMTGGLITLDPNTGVDATSSSDQYIFSAPPAMQSFSFTGGTLQMIDPPYPAGSQSISSAYAFGVNSILQLGDGVSVTTSKNPNGFGGSALPSNIGTLILDAATLSNNRIFKNLSPITTKKVEVRSGNLVLGALLTVQP